MVDVEGVVDTEIIQSRSRLLLLNYSVDFPKLDFTRDVKTFNWSEVNQHSNVLVSSVIVGIDLGFVFNIFGCCTFTCYPGVLNMHPLLTFISRHR